MATEPQQVRQDAGAGYCNWHPETETRLYCSQCGKNICTLCMVQAPVGIRCRECGRSEKLPTYDVQPTYYLRAIAVGVAIAVVGGILWGILDNSLQGIPFVSWLLGLAVAYGAAELVSRSVNRKRGDGLALVTGSAVALAGIIHLYFIWPLGGFSLLINLLIVALAVYTAVTRIR